MFLHEPGICLCFVGNAEFEGEASLLNVEYRTNTVKRNRVLTFGRAAAVIAPALSISRLPMNVHSRNCREGTKEMLPQLLYVNTFVAFCFILVVVFYFVSNHINMGLLRSRRDVGER